MGVFIVIPVNTGMNRTKLYARWNCHGRIVVFPANAGTNCRRPPELLRAYCMFPANAGTNQTGFTGDNHDRSQDGRVSLESA